MAKILYKMKLGERFILDAGKQDDLDYGTIFDAGGMKHFKSRPMPMVSIFSHTHTEWEEFDGDQAEVQRLVEAAQEV